MLVKLIPTRIVGGDIMGMTDKDFFAELEKRPDLKNRFKEIMAISANNGNELITLADDAEMRVISQMRQLGKETLQNWAETESKRVANNTNQQLPSAKKHVKKNSGGTVPTEK